MTGDGAQALLHDADEVQVVGAGGDHHRVDRAVADEPVDLVDLRWDAQLRLLARQSVRLYGLSKFPGAGSSRPVTMPDPEQARWTNVTVECGSACSIASAALADPAAAERWQRLFCQRVRAGCWLNCAKSGLPSPDADESPSDTISQSRIVTHCVVRCDPTSLVTVSVTGYVPSAVNCSDTKQPPPAGMRRVGNCHS